MATEQIKQSRLEEEGILKRDELQHKNRYYNDVAANLKEEYSQGHKDAISNGDPLGKGANQSMRFSIPDRKASKTAIDRSNFITTESDAQSIGGKYDIYGYGSIEGKSGRIYLEGINLYNPRNEYGSLSVDTSQNVLDGQIVVK